MTAGVKRERKKREETGEQECKKIRTWGGERGRGRLVTVLSSSARNCCPEIMRTIRSCQDQHTHTQHAQAASSQYTHIHYINGTRQSTKHSHAHKVLCSVSALQQFFISNVSASFIQSFRGPHEILTN